MSNSNEKTIDHNQIQPPVVVIAGPTASGKSGLALKLAERLDGEIVNADSMQIYKDLPILSAIPSPSDQARIAHHGYAVLDAGERCSVARWLNLTREIISDLHGRGKIPIMVGGTGMYIRAAIEGISPIPDIDPAFRQEASAQFDAIGGAAFRKSLAEKDPVLAARLNDGDRQRLIRGMEVVLATGTPLSRLQDIPLEGKLNATFTTIAIMPPRDQLYDAINQRYPMMLADGGIEEAAQLMKRGLDPSLPLMKAVGLPPVFSYLRGEIEKDEMVSMACQDTRRYAKRQMTWFNNQYQANFREDSEYSEQLSESFIKKILSNVIFNV